MKEKLVRIKSNDGIEMPGILYTPKDDSENMSSNFSLEETESGEHKIKKKNVTWKNME